MPVQESIPKVGHPAEKERLGVLLYELGIGRCLDSCFQIPLE